MSINKRECISDPRLEIELDDLPDLNLEELRSFAVLNEKPRDINALTELGSSSQQNIEKDDWDEPLACRFIELLTDNLLATFRGAVKKIIKCGYNEKDAELAVLNIGLHHGYKDFLPNVVDGALALLNTEMKFGTSKVSLFEGLERLVDYKIVEMVHVLLEVKPHLTVAEAMWCLLISDFNLLNACALEGGPRGDYLSRKVSGDSSESFQFRFDVIHSDSNRLELAGTRKESCLSLEEQKGKFSVISKEHIQTKSQAKAAEEKPGGNKKGSSADPKRDINRPKPFDFEKSLKGRLFKGAFKPKVAASGSIASDKSWRSNSGSSSVPKKGTDSNLSAISSGSSGSIVESSDSQSGVSAFPAANSRSPGSSMVPDSNREFIHETLRKCVSRDEKGETIMKLVACNQALEKELHGWADWANNKVMEAAQRLGKEQADLKMLRQEKEEIEKLKKERQTSKENAMKRISEIEIALSSATGKIEVATSTARLLEKENSFLNKEKEAVRLQETASVTRLHEALEGEQEAKKKCQLQDAETGLLREKLTSLKGESSELESPIARAKARSDQFKALLKHEEMEKARADMKIEALRKEREEIEAVTDAEAEEIKQTADAKLHKCKEDIKKLEHMISELRLESEKAKIAALTAGYSTENCSTSQILQHRPKRTKRLPVFEDIVGDRSVQPERNPECVMCMTKEISVVFLPCAHQVLCGECNEIHEKKRMKDCPSCRATIQKRITVAYRS